MNGTIVDQNEAARIKSLKMHGILDTESDPYLENLTRITARTLRVPMVMVNLVDADRQWAKAAFGLPNGYEIPRAMAFCSHTILATDHVTIIHDMLEDARLSSNPLVIDGPKLRFYAGAAITDAEGRALGALCVLDTKPRKLADADIVFLQQTAEAVSARLELYRSNAALRESQEHYRSAAELNPHMPWTASADGETEEAEGRWLSLVGTPSAASTRRGWVRAVHPDDFSLAQAAWGSSIKAGEPLDLEYRLRLADGSYRWFRVRAAPKRDRLGLIMRWYGTIEDIADRKAADAAHQETQTRLRLALDVAKLRTWELDLASRRLTASDVSVLNFGLQLGAEVSDYDLALARIHPDDEQRYGREVAEAWASGQELEIEYRSIWPDDSVHWVRITGRPTQDASGKPVRLVGLSLDITEQRTAEAERQRAEARVAYLANHDPLTGLANRRRFQHALAGAMAAATPTAMTALLRIDLDDFKIINDSMGHEIGDRMLQHAANLLRSSVGRSSLVARYDSDDFALIVAGVTSRRDIDGLAANLLQSIGEPFQIDGQQRTLRFSIGIAIAPDDSHTAEQLLRNAETALQRAKKTNRGGYSYFQSDVDAHVQDQAELKLSLRDALSRGELSLFYQPLVNLETGAIVCFEALMRWQHPTRGFVSPADFIPLAEETGWIIAMGRWALEEACREAATWPDEVSVAVNLSAVQFDNNRLEAEVAAALSRSGLRPARLELEVTETLLLNDDEANTKVLRALRKLGVRIAMDDFGTGYSSLGYLRRFAFDKIKIDQSLMRDLPDNAGGDAIVHAIIGLADSLGISVTAEGVETQKQLEFLRDLGCGQVQGYLFSRPVPSADVPGLLARNLGLVSQI